MPTYYNNSNLDVDVSEIALHIKAKSRVSSIVVIPESLLLGKYANLGITQLSIYPCYNPIVAEHIVNFVDETDEQLLTLNVRETDYVQIRSPNLTGHVFLQDKANEPPIRFGYNDLITVRTEYRVEKMIFIPDFQGSLLLIEYKDEIKYERWTTGSYRQETIRD